MSLFKPSPAQRRFLAIVVRERLADKDRELPLNVADRVASSLHWDNAESAAVLKELVADAFVSVANHRIYLEAAGRDAGSLAIERGDGVTGRWPWVTIVICTIAAAAIVATATFLFPYLSHEPVSPLAAPLQPHPQQPVTTAPSATRPATPSPVSELAFYRHRASTVLGTNNGTRPTTRP